jgi:hypothetical protein
MNNRPAALSFGWNLGIISGLFAALQILISASSARANIASIESMRWALARVTTGGGNPVPLIGSLTPVLLVTYGSMIVTGAICLVLCWYAGRLTAYVRGSRSGAGAGFQVALLSGLLWIAFAIIISVLLHADGTITGVLASTRDGSSLGFQLSGLLIQQIIFASIGLGLGAWAGALGARSAPLPVPSSAAAPAFAPHVVYGTYPMYPPAVAGYPAYGGYQLPPSSYQQLPPPAPMGSVPPSYPPPPNYYHAPDVATSPSVTPQEPQAPRAPGQTPAPTEPPAIPPAE